MGEDAVELHEAGLVARASAILRARPELRIVGLVAEADTPEATSLRAAEGDALRAADGSVAVIVTRESAKKLLGQVTPALLDWLEDDGEETGRKLPVIHVARRGLRTTSIDYGPSE